MDLSRFDLPRYLSMLPLFQEMQPPELQRLALGSRLRHFARGDDVFHIYGVACKIDRYNATISAFGCCG